MITYKQIREKIQGFDKHSGCQRRERAPLIHEGFVGTFNLSFTEYEWLKEFGSYSEFDRDFVYSTVQSCVRPQDIDENIRNGRDLWKYLGVFEMADLSGQVILAGRNNSNELHLEHIRKLKQLFVELGLDIRRVHPSFNAGGSVAELTKGKYKFDFEVPEDKLSRRGFIDIGIPAENLIPDQTRDTFLSLHLNRRSPWGYRNEINYNIGTSENPVLLDIATLERMCWIPTYSGDKERAEDITCLEEINHTLCVSGIGLERLTVAVNGLRKVQDVDYIREFYNAFRQEVPDLSEEQRYKAGEVIRTLHRIYSDVQTFEIDLSRHRNDKIKRFLQVLRANAGSKLSNANLDTLLRANAESQPWHTNLSEGIEPTKKRILTYLRSRENE